MILKHFVFHCRSISKAETEKKKHQQIARLNRDRKIANRHVIPNYISFSNTNSNEAYTRRTHRHMHTGRQRHILLYLGKPKIEKNNSCSDHRESEREGARIE